jgi:hypothetical protein
MAIIDPEGLFSGERLGACSDFAQLCWPRLFLAANSCGRIELSYNSIISRVFGNFEKPPKSSELWEVFREYERNFLAVLYESDGGVWWCQFITSEKFLPKYKKTRDELSPVPSVEAMEKHRRGYLGWKKANSFQNQSFQKTSQDFGREGVGIGVGIGGGIGIGEKPIATEKPSRRDEVYSPRYHRFADLLQRYWREANPDNPELPWGKKDIAQLQALLTACPSMTEEQFWLLLSNRARSDIPQGQRAYLWLANVTKFTEPLDRYDKPMRTGGSNADISKQGMGTLVGVSAESIARGEHQGGAYTHGDLQAGEVESGGLEVSFRDLHEPPKEHRSPSVPSRDGDPVGDSEERRPDRAPIPWGDF